MKSPKEDISAVLIAHNEEASIGKMIEGLLARYHDRLLELIVVDDCSHDKTASIVESWQRKNNKVRLVKKGPPCGVGLTLKTGFASVNPKAGYILTMDSDFVENLDDVGRMIKEIETSNCDGVIGSRFTAGGRLVRYPKLKLAMNRGYHYLVRALFRIGQKDLTNNFKLYKSAIVRGMPWRSDDFSINAETGILPIISGYVIREVPVSWIGRDADMGKSKFRLFKVGLGYLRVIAYAWSLRMNRI